MKTKKKKKRGRKTKEELHLEKVKKAIEDLEDDGGYLSKYSNLSCVTVINLEKSWEDDEVEEEEDYYYYTADVMLNYDMDQKSETFFDVTYPRKIIEERIKEHENKKRDNRNKR